MRNKHLTCSLLIALFAVVGCKREADQSQSSGSSESPSVISPAIAQSPTNSSCSVASVGGGAEITCGDSVAIVQHGTSAVANKVPRLIDGDQSGDPSRPEILVGDHVISVTKDGSLNELITIWVENADAILQYQNGVVIPRDRAVYFNSNDCSGQGMYQTNPNITSYSQGMGDRIIYWDNYYRIGSKRVHCYPRSKREQDGTCTAIASSTGNDFLGFEANRVNPGVTTVLTAGYKIKMR